MSDISPKVGIGTLVNHWSEGDNTEQAHVTPIYQTSTFSFPDAEAVGRYVRGEEKGHMYTRGSNPNADQLAEKIAVLEGLDLIRQRPGVPVAEVVAGRVFSSGMAAITASILGRVEVGQTVVTQRALYGNSFRFFNELAPRMGIKVVWLEDLSVASWEAALSANPGTVMVYTETPTNPAMEVVDLAPLVEMAHQIGAWVVVDNTFATPFHTRPLTLGCDIVVHSTTKYLSGHGVLLGGAAVSSHVEYINTGDQGLGRISRVMGGTPSPFDCWLANLGLKTFELRMARHSHNGMAVARFLASHPQIEQVYYPGLESHAGHEIARRQMFDGYGGMMAFDVKGGEAAGAALMERLQLATLAVSLGNVDSLIEHPATMTHSSLTPEERAQAGIGEGLLRYSVGIENTEDLLADFEQALK